MTSQVQWVKPLLSKDIPPDTYATWDEVNEVWVFKPLSELNPETIIKTVG
jgi:hypothetical protein